jgi:hypothetical protein
VTVKEGDKVAWVESVSAKGVYRLQSGETKHDTPICYLKLPNKPGDKWDFAEGRIKGTMTSFEQEQVTVPAGTFTAIRIEMVESLRPPRPGDVVPVPPKWTFWYAPGVGLVKQTRTGMPGTFGSEMQSFTPAK